MSSERYAQHSLARLHPVLTLSLIIGLVISTIGDEIYLAVMILQFENLGSSGYIIAGFLASQLVPSVLLAPISGQLIDRFETSRVLVITQILQTFLLIAMANTTSVLLLLLGATILGSLFAISQPALYALIPTIAQHAQISTKRVNAIVEFFTRSAMLVGPAIGGLLLGTLGASAALLVNAATFAFAAYIVVMIGIRRPPPKTGNKQRLFEGALEGIKLIRHDSVLSVTMPIIFTGFISISLVGVTAVFLLRNVLEASPIVYGLIIALWGLGMLIGSFIAGKNDSTEKLERPVTLGMTVMGSALLIVGIFPRLIVMIFTEIYGGIANGIMNVSINSMLHERSPKEMHGRVFAAYVAMGRIAIILGYAIASPFAASYPVLIYIISGTLTAIIGLLGFLRINRLKV